MGYVVIPIYSPLLTNFLLQIKFTPDNVTKQSKKGKNSRVVAIGLIVAFVGLVLLGCCIFHRLRRRRKPQEAGKYLVNLFNIVKTEF